jgi:cation transport regulator ChaB
MGAARTGKARDMPKTTAKGEPRVDELPAPVARSGSTAQRTFAKVHDSALEVRGHHGDEEYAHRAAYGALKHSYEKVGDRWEPKARTGPSDARAARGGPGPSTGTHSGIDANASKTHLLELARRRDLPGRSRMTKEELVEALEADSRRADDRARGG